MDEQKGKRKISNTTAVIFTCLAFGADAVNILLDFIPIVGFILVPINDFLAMLFFSIAFSHCNASLWSSKRAGGTLLTIVVDAIPFGDFTFPWTWRVASVAFNERFPPQEA